MISLQPLRLPSPSSPEFTTSKTPQSFGTIFSLAIQAAVISIATAGNFIGGLTSYGVGRIGKWEWIERFGVKAETLEKQKAKIDKYGSWAALMSWVPIIGDVIAVALGFYRTKFLPSALFMLIGKAGRFIAWYALWQLTTMYQ